MSPEWVKPEKYLTIRKSQVKLQTERSTINHTGYQEGNSRVRGWGGGG